MRANTLIFIASAAAAIAATPARALVEVIFEDGAPWDVFTVRTLDCPIVDAALTIDMTTSVAGALIDTEYGGPGTQDPLPAELAEGDAVLAPVQDGDQRLEVLIANLLPDGALVLRMDLDDSKDVTFGASVHVAGEEMAGATVSLIYDGVASTATFERTGIARLPLPASLPDCRMLS